jgi:hypothetical protein
MRAKLVFEKFEEKSDPIQDMGIGPRYVYDNLKSGDVLMITKDLAFAFSLCKKDSILKIISVQKIFIAGTGVDKELLVILYDNIIDYYNNNVSSSPLNSMGDKGGYWAINFNLFKKYFTIINPK